MFVDYVTGMIVDTCSGPAKMLIKVFRRAKRDFILGHPVPFHLQPCHKFLMFVEMIEDISDGEEHNEGVIDSDDSVTSLETSCISWCVVTDIGHLNPCRA